MTNMVMERQLYMINVKDDDFYLDLKYLDGLYPPHQSKVTRLDPFSGKSLSREEAAKIDHEALDELDELLASLDDDETTEDTKPSIAEPTKAEPTKAEALRTRERKPVAKKLVKQAQPTEDDLADVVEEFEAPVITGLKKYIAELARLRDLRASEATLKSSKIASVTTGQLLDWVDEITKEASKKSTKTRGPIYDEAEDRLLLMISERLDELGIYPIHRPYNKPIWCNQAVASLYMQRLQISDVRFYWLWGEGQTPVEVQYSELFQDREDFNYELAAKIAAKKWRAQDHTDEKTGKFTPGKVTALGIPESFQMKLSVLKSDKVRQRQDDKKGAKLKFQSKLREHVTGKGGRRQLTEDRILEHGNVFMSMKLAGDSISKAIIEYKGLTGDKISRNFIRNRLPQIKELS